MFAPKPAIRGNGHAAIIRIIDVDRHLMEPDKLEGKIQLDKTDKQDKKPKPKH